jgi:hypothetical protein
MSNTTQSDAAGDTSDHVCCPPFDPSTYYDDNGNEHKLITWKNKPFAKDGTRCFYYIPLRFGQAVIRLLDRISTAGAGASDKDVMILSDCVSPWYSNIFMSVAKEEVEGAAVEKISGVFVAKAFQGDYSKMGGWAKEMEELVSQVKRTVAMDDGEGKMDLEVKVKSKSKEHTEPKMYFHYPTCPKCSKKYKANHVVIFARLSE